MTYEVKIFKGRAETTPPDVGKIEKNPEAHNPAELNQLAAPKIQSRYWLRVGFDEEPFGDGVKMTKKYRLSGKRKWLEDIYK